MKKLVQIGLVVFSTAMIAVPAMAAPQERIHQNQHNNLNNATHVGSQQMHPAAPVQQHSQQRQQEMVQKIVY